MIYFHCHGISTIQELQPIVLNTILIWVGIFKNC